MNKKKGATLFVMGMVLSILGMTILTDNQTLKYMALILGVVLMIYSVFVLDKWKKNQ